MKNFRRGNKAHKKLNWGFWTKNAFLKIEKIKNFGCGIERK
jgi:hypothetical protein